MHHILYLRPHSDDLKKRFQSFRLEILNFRLGRMSVKINVDLERMADKTDGYSGAEIVALCEQAARIAMRENKDANIIETRHFLYVA